MGNDDKIKLHDEQKEFEIVEHQSGNDMAVHFSVSKVPVLIPRKRRLGQLRGQGQAPSKARDP